MKEEEQKSEECVECRSIEDQSLDMRMKKLENLFDRGLIARQISHEDGLIEAVTSDDVTTSRVTTNTNTVAGGW